MHQISLETARETERMNQFAVYNHIEMVEVEPDHAIVLYERNVSEDNVTNKMVFKGNIEEISDCNIRIRLRAARTRRPRADAPGQLLRRGRGDGA